MIIEDRGSMGLVEEVRTLTLFKRGSNYWSDGSDEDVQIILHWRWRVWDDVLRTEGSRES